MVQKDNTTLRLKVNLRKQALKHLDCPVVMETHGGNGKIFEMCYHDIDAGVVFEKNPEKSKNLGLQRPSWRVYEADCVAAIKSCVASDMAINFLDVDPYGDPWPVIDAFFGTKRNRADVFCVAVNDGLRMKAAIGAWNTKSLQNIVAKYGNKLHHVYLEVCQELLKEKAGKAGYDLSHFSGYYCGHSKRMTHYLGVLKLNGAEVSV